MNQVCMAALLYRVFFCKRSPWVRNDSQLPFTRGRQSGKRDILEVYRVVFRCSPKQRLKSYSRDFDPWILRVGPLVGLPMKFKSQWHIKYCNWVATSMLTNDNYLRIRCQQCRRFDGILCLMSCSSYFIRGGSIIFSSIGQCQHT